MKNLSKILIILITILFFEVLLFTPLDFLYDGDEISFCGYPNILFDYLIIINNNAEIIIMPDVFCKDFLNPFYDEKLYAGKGKFILAGFKVDENANDKAKDPKPLTVKQMLNDKQEPRERHEPTHEAGEYPKDDRGKIIIDESRITPIDDGK